jgi:hypothetical protein
MNNVIILRSVYGKVG